jgi:hypothetical protein
MAHRSSPDDVINLARSEWKDWTGAEDALSKLARIAGARRRRGPEPAAGPKAAAQPSAAPTPSPKETPAPRRPRRPRALRRYLIAFCFGIAATLGWQAHGESAKRVAAGWIAAAWDGHGEPAKQMTTQWFAEVWRAHGEPARQAIARWVPQVSWPAPEREARSAGQRVEGDPVDRAIALHASSLEILSSDLADLRKGVEEIAANQAQMARDIAKLQASEQAIRQKTPSPSGAGPTRNHPSTPPGG